MPGNAAKRRRARDERKAANQPQRRHFGRSAFNRHLAVGLYVSLIVAGLFFIAGGAFWGALSGSADPAHAQAAADGAGRNEVRATAALASMSPSASQLAIEEQIDRPLPPQSGVASQTSAQTLPPPIETAAPAPTAAPAETRLTRGIIDNVNITFYDCANQGFCGAMYNGRKVYEGAAACSWNLSIGTRFVIVGDPTHRIYTCEDRGLLANTWVDIFWYHPSDGYNWQRHVGRYGTIEIVSTP